MKWSPLCWSVLLLCVFYGSSRCDAAPAQKERDAYTSVVMTVMDILANVGSFNEVKEVMTKALSGLVTKKACAICNSVVSLVANNVRSDRSAEDFMNVLKNVCALFRVARPEVCSGAIDLYKDEIIYIMQNLICPIEEVCSVYLGPTCGDLQSPVHNWTIDVDQSQKPASRPFPVITEGGRSIRVLQLADTHYDPEYKPGSNGDCGDPICCRSGSPATPEATAGNWGYPGDCDIPLRTLESMMQHAASSHKIDMILWTGDLPPHDPWKARREDSVANLRTTSALIRQYFPGVPVFPALGNHEAVPINSFPVQNPSHFNNEWLYSKIAKEWGEFLPQSTLDTVRRGGFYAVKAADRLRIVSLNTNFCYTYNWWLLYNSTDPEGQLQWLVNELQAAEDAGDKIILIGHIPPGFNECTKVWSNQFHKIINRYESTITAQMYGHLHSDELQVYYDLYEPQRPISVVYVAPSVTTYREQNPGYRVYIVDGNHSNATWTVTDHETYVMNVTDANITDEPRWELEYVAKKEYGLGSLSPSEWSDLTARIKDDDKLFQKYYKFLNKLHPKDTCDADCKKGKISSMQARVLK